MTSGGSGESYNNSVAKHIKKKIRIIKKKIRIIKIMTIIKMIIRMIIKLKISLNSLFKVIIKLCCATSVPLL
jgi:CRISPR/Cas system-associated protein Cas5 (RAMP superfamily)